MRRKRKRTARPKASGKSAAGALAPIQVKAGDDISVNADEVGVVFTNEQRALLKRLMEKAIKVMFGVEIGVEIGPDGSVRFIGRLRS
jgi:hypothetical protein